jgi:DNA adenine methylase
VNSLSPLRYPGGKAKILDFMRYLVVYNFKGKKPVYVEPYAGGAGVALGLLLNDDVSEIHINDFDRAIYWFWNDIKYHSKELIKKIQKTDVTLKEWFRQREIYNKGKEGFDLGFATFFLNRCNHSGIITGGCIGGIPQDGRYKIDCRYNKEELIQRIKRISSVKDRIRLYNEDTAGLLMQNRGNFKNCLLYLDPPYYEMGRKLYQSHYNDSDHEKIAKIMKRLGGYWVVSYDNKPFVVDLYMNFRPYYFNLTYCANSIRDGKEVMFFSKRLKHIPDTLNFNTVA